MSSAHTKIDAGRNPFQFITLKTRRNTITRIAGGVLLCSFFLFVAIPYGCAVAMPGNSFEGTLPQSTEDEQEIRNNLEAHVRVLADDIGERNLSHRYLELKEAADFIERSFKSLGYEVSSQGFTVQGKSVRNLIAELQGTALKDEIVVVGAHYDSARDTPAANDNASGVAGILETARLLKNERPARTIRFVAFVNEEPPYFHTENMGSLRYARQCKARGENIVAMLSYETIGYFSDKPNSQQYPPLLRSFYPTVGNFITFVGNIGSRSLARRCVKAFRDAVPFPSEGAALPGGLTGVDWSDHWSFWEAGYDAVMVTDTATFRYPYYHEAEDTPDKINFERTARVIRGLTQVVRSLASDN